jgi:cbb3-type cytochrome oxidase maturation protein
MSVIYVLLPVAVLFAAGALYLFIRSVRRGQFDDLDTPAIRMLHDDEGREPRATRDGDDGDRTEP